MKTPIIQKEIKIRIKTGINAGYWTCTGVHGTPNKKGVIKPAYASQCWK